MARIRVRSKVSGKMGTIEAGRYDPIRYEQITPTPTPEPPMAPQQPQNSNLLNQIGGVARNVGNFVAPQTTKSITQGPSQILGAMARQPTPRGNMMQRIPQAFSNAAQSTGELAKVVGRPAQVGETAFQALTGRPGQATGLMT